MLIALGPPRLSTVVGPIIYENKAPVASFGFAELDFRRMAHVGTGNAPWTPNPIANDRH